MTATYEHDACECGYEQAAQAAAEADREAAAQRAAEAAAGFDDYESDAECPW